MNEHTFYAVGHGKKPGVYEKWSDVQAQTKDFPQPVYKKFATKEEAEEYVKERRPEGVSLDVDEAAEKFYAIARGKMVGVFTDYNEVKKHIADYPQPLYKKFEKLDEAKSYYKKFSGSAEDGNKSTQESLKSAAPAVAKKHAADDANGAKVDKLSKESAAVHETTKVITTDGHTAAAADKHNHAAGENDDDDDDDGEDVGDEGDDDEEPEEHANEKLHKTHITDGRKRAHDVDDDGVEEKAAKAAV